MIGAARSPQWLAGTVTSFDEVVGLGTVCSADGETYPFHCIEIANGTRLVRVGEPVGFVLLAKLGRMEASRIESLPLPLAGTSPPSRW